MDGSAEEGWIVCTPLPGMEKWMTSAPASPFAHSPGIAPEAVFVFAATIASRSVHLPSSAAASEELFTTITAECAAPAASDPAAARARARPRRRRLDFTVSDDFLRRKMGKVRRSGAALSTAAGQVALPEGFA